MKRTALLLFGLVALTQLAEGKVPLPQDGLTTRVEVSLEADHHNAHIVWIRGSAFELRIVPTFDASNDIDSWEVGVFSFADTSRHSRNLLAPRANWHGLQPFHVLPGDVEGAGTYPARRVIERAEFTCTIDVVSGTTKPSRATPGARVFKSLRLAIEIALKANEPSSKSEAEPRQR